MNSDQVATRWERQADDLAAKSGAKGLTAAAARTMRAQADQLRQCAQQLRLEGEDERHADGITCPYCGQDSHVEINGDEQELPCPSCRQILRVEFVSYLMAS